MKKITGLYASLLTAMIIVLAACSMPSPINGLWKDTQDDGTIEFKGNGDVIVVDNMSVTVMGTYTIENDNLITFEFTASDILRDSIEPIEKTVVTAKIIKLEGDELQLSFFGDTKTEIFSRVR